MLTPCGLVKINRMMQEDNGIMELEEEKEQQEVVAMMVEKKSEHLTQSPITGEWFNNHLMNDIKAKRVIGL